MLLIGPYTHEFKKLYDEFIRENRERKDRVILVGNVENKTELYDYYNKAKVFILTSRWESFGIVLTEALRFGDYIITTDVGAARDITEDGKIGAVINSDNLEQLESEIKKVINNTVKLDEKYNESINLAKNRFLWHNIVKNEEFKNFFEKGSD